MPHSVLFYRERDEIPVLYWLEALNDEPQDRLQEKIDRLAEEGHFARRPLVENLGDGIYELRARVGRENYRILFSFYARNAVLLTCGFTKEREIPPDEIRRARVRLQEFLANPANHYAELEQ
jgi:phage-related protein